MSDKPEEAASNPEPDSTSIRPLYWLFLIFSPSIWAVPPATLFAMELLKGLDSTSPRSIFPDAAMPFVTIIGILWVAIFGIVAIVGPIRCAWVVVDRLQLPSALRFIAGFAIWSGIGALNAFVSFGACVALSRG